MPDLLLNISGMLRDERVLERAPVRVYLDLDPAFNQLWHAQGVDVGLDGHTHHVTVGRRVPPTGHDWIHTLPPVVLERWPVADRIETDAFTTVANFRAYGSIEHDGVRYGQKAHSLRALLDLPTRTDERFALALDIHPDEPDLAALREHGWTLLDPRRVAGTPDDYAAFVRGSKAEIGIAKEGYVVSRCGWFGDRSAAYLASGRPVVAQDTGFGERLPIGAGLFAFAGTDDVLAADRSDPFRLRAACEGRPGDRGGAPRLRLVLTRLLRELGAGAARATSLDPRRDRCRARGAARRDADSPPSVRVSLQCSARRARGRTGGAAAQGSLAAGSERPGARSEAGLPARPGSRDRGVPLAARRSGSRYAGARGRRRRSRPRAVLARRREGGGNRALPARDRALGTGGSVARAAA